MFPSPLGASYFQIVIDVDCHREMHRFRPLSGHLISKSYSSPVKQGCHCFRPLSGHLISKLNSFLASKKIVLVSVPSRGILFPNCFSYTVYRRFDSWFPSPLGASYFQIVLRLVYGYTSTSAKVSVPSRGILFPNTYQTGIVITFLLFPSPLGASYFQI